MTSLIMNLAMDNVQMNWLLEPSSYRSKVTESRTGWSISNGLITRKFDKTTFSTISMRNEMTGAEMLRAVEPEAVIEVNGKRYAVGGLVGQPDRAYLTSEFLSKMHSDPAAFQLKSVRKSTSIDTPIPWKPMFVAQKKAWPPKGITLTATFEPPKGSDLQIKVIVVYELFDGIPLLSKKIAVTNIGTKSIILNKFESERLALVEAESAVGDQVTWRRPHIYFASDYMFGGDNASNAGRFFEWQKDPAYTTQVNYNLSMPATFVSRPEIGPQQTLLPGSTFISHRTYELLHDSDNRERQGLSVRAMYRTVAPWITENPLMLHVVSSDPAVIKNAIDQCAKVGFELVILSFGSGLNMEDTSAANIQKYKSLADYAHSKGIKLGGYSLLASRRIDDKNDVINPKTGKTGGAIFGNSPCLCSEWGQHYFENIKSFIEETGFDMLEHDGNYPGDVCASADHPGHKGLEDSQWNQWKMITDFYHWCRQKSIFLNVPDMYHLAGSNKTAMGYRESNWSLPRAQQHIHCRQNLYDGTWEKPPTMGWMFVPLTEYQGGGAAATIEPLSDHLSDYKMHLQNNLGFGAQACYRGFRLFDTPATEKMVREQVAWFKAHRAILESDIIHLRRADGQSMDAILHVNPTLPEQAMLIVWNPSTEAQKMTLDVPLHYAGLREKCSVSESGRSAKNVKISPEGTARLEMILGPNQMGWWTFTK